MDLDAIQQKLYSDIPGYSLSSAGRARLQRESDPALTYGEVTPESVQAMLEAVGTRPGEVFYDLGSGTGKAVIFAALMNNFARCTGIELVEDLWASAELARQRYESDVRPNLPVEQVAEEVSFLNGDMFDFDISDADVVFTHCTCFDDAMMSRISSKLETLKPGSRVITVTKGLVSPAFTSIGSTLYRLGWGEATMCYFVRS